MKRRLLFLTCLLPACATAPIPDDAFVLDDAGGVQHDARVESLDADLVVGEGGQDAARRSPADASGVDAADDADDAARADAGAQDGAPEAGQDTGPVTCTRTLRVLQVIASSSGCTLNQNVTSGPATLTYPCAGGAATAVFGAQTFTGTVSSGGTVSLTNVDPFPFGGCTWQSTQTIAGALSSPPLSYSYSEHVVSSGCSGIGACTASGSVQVN